MVPIATRLYDPVNNKWKFLPPPTTQRTSHAIIATETHIYVIGGEGLGIAFVAGV